VILIIAAGLACNVPIMFQSYEGSEGSGDDPNPVEIAIVKSLTAVAKDDDEDSGLDDSHSAQEFAEKTPTPTPSPTYTSTPTPKPQVHISENTNCRYGPGSVYDLIFTYLAGDFADLIGKDEDEIYWFVQHQDQQHIDCWLWGKYATPIGKTTDLPILTPPPTPTPVVDFVITYKEVSCDIVVVKIMNVGDLTLESWSSAFKDKDTGEKINNSSNQFLSGVKIPVGKTDSLGSGTFSANPQGHKIKATITICTDDSQSGMCVTKVAEFKAN
jgi:hypothetical protein